MATVETNTVTVTINGREATVPKGLSLVEAAAEAGIGIPVFCFEPRLGAAVGACRMCLVEIEGMPKLQTACTTPVADGMVVHSRSDRAGEGQDAVLEFLLLNHPLDCPVCDKGGECPVGALTSTTYRFRARPWEIQNIPTVCGECPVGCNIYATIREGHVQRVLSRNNPAVDDGWLCDRGRYSSTSMHAAERITAPLI